MPFVAADWSISTNGDIRYIGDDHGGSNPSYATVIEFHRALQDFADDALASGDDIMDISKLTPSSRSTDNIITLENGYNIDQEASEHLYDGSIIQSGGAEIWDGIVNFGNPAFIIVHQNGQVYTNDFWNSFTPDGFNADAGAGISHRFMIKVRDGGADIDGRRLLGLSREFTFTYSEFSINGTSRGNNVLALSEADDLNNDTAEGTVATWTDVINLSEGYVGLDINNDTTNEFYYSQWDFGSRSVNEVYERLKYLTRRGSTEFLYGLPGDLFRGITHQIAISSPSGTFVEGDLVRWTGATPGTGQLLAINSPTAGTTMWIQLLTGQPPTVSSTITSDNSGNGSATTGTVIGRTINSPFVGQSTGSAIIGGYGVGFDPNDLQATDSVFDLTNTQITPPNNVTFTVGGLEAGEDRVLVGPDTGATALNKSQLELETTLSGAAEGTVVVSTPIPTDTPASGTIRVVNDAGFDVRLPYSSFSGNQFNLTGTYDFSGVNENEQASGAADNSQGAGVYITYIDELASGATATFTVVYASDRDLFIRVRDGGGTPIVTFETSGTLGSTGGSVTAIRTSDA